MVGQLVDVLIAQPELSGQVTEPVLVGDPVAEKVLVAVGSPLNHLEKTGSPISVSSAVGGSRLARLKGA